MGRSPLAQSTAKLLQRLGGHQISIAIEPAEIFHQCEPGAVELVLIVTRQNYPTWSKKRLSRYSQSICLEADGFFAKDSGLDLLAQQMKQLLTQTCTDTL